MEESKNNTTGTNPAELQRRAKAIRDAVMARSVTAEQVGGLFLDIVKTSCNPIAGRYWNENNSTPKASGYYGDLQALRDLPKKLGLGRYLVTDDRQRRKLNPMDSTLFEDGTPAALDGSMGQCMWCWNAHYFTTWKEGDNTVMAVTFAPIEGKNSIYVPEGGISWMDAGVVDRAANKLCSIISESERCRGGVGSAIEDEDPDTPKQFSMLGMPCTGIDLQTFRMLARNRGKGWEANWYVARAVVEYLFEIIMGTRNSQEAFSGSLDENGLYQGGFGQGVTAFTDWGNYNKTLPLIPTSVGLEAGDGVGLVNYDIPAMDGSVVKTYQVPVFFGLVNAGFGNLGRMVSGVTVSQASGRMGWVYVAPSLYADYDPATTGGMVKVAECSPLTGFIKDKSYDGLCCIGKAVGGSASTFYCDVNLTGLEGLFMRVAGGFPQLADECGVSCSVTTEEYRCNYTYFTSPLCYFAEDPRIEL